MPFPRILPTVLRACLLALLALLVTRAAAAQETPILPLETGEDTVAASTLPLQPPPDERIAERLRTVFGAIDEFENVQVSVEHGVVHLSGTVLQPETVDEAQALAARFEGVLYVDNDITAETDVETRLSPALARMQRYVEQALAFLPIVGVALAVLLLFGLASYLIGKWEAPRRRLGINPLVWQLTRRLLRGVVFFVGLLLAFDILGITAMVGAVLGTAGVVGLALGFAFQDIVENYLAGMLLSLRRPFRVNDLVKIAEHEGKVVRLTSRELILLSLDGNHVRLPNATVFKSSLVNYTLNPRRVFWVEVRVAAGADLDRAIEVGLSTLGALNGVLPEPPPFERVQEIGGADVCVRFFAWVDQESANYFKVQSEGTRLLKAAFDEAGVTLSEPAFRVYLDDEAVVPAALPANALRRARSVDVSPSRTLEDQVEAERRTDVDDDLLRD